MSKSTKQPIDLIIRCDFSQATATPAQVTRWLLKRLLRTFGVRVLSTEFPGQNQLASNEVEVEN
ncbi:MAG: hypothetical protein IID41_03610 [Planctomycetes bacterium]|nr:hypothetical protein [Planctomycetota bacterium]